MKHPFLRLLMIVGLAVTARLAVSLQAATQVVAWGNFGLTNVPPNLTNVVAIAASHSNNTVLTSDGTVTYWEVGVDGLSPTRPGLTNVVAISGGEYHTVALRGDGSVVVWGDYGVDAAPAGYTQPVDPWVPQDLTNIVAVAAGESCSLALKADGTVVEWGVDNGYDRIGVPPGLSNVIAIATGSGCCSQVRGALELDGTLLAWTDAKNFSSIQTGTNEFIMAATNQYAPPADLTGVVALAAGYSHSLALRGDGTVVAWGDNSAGQTNVPVDLTNAVGIAAGGNFSLALKEDGSVVSWGGNRAAPLGLTNVVRVVASSDEALVLKADGTVEGWGDNYFGQTNPPPELINVVSISVGWDHGLALVGEGPPVQQAAIHSAHWRDGRFESSIATESGRVYQLEFKNSLSDGHWTPLPLVPGIGRLITLNDPGASASRRFYRIRRW